MEFVSITPTSPLATGFSLEGVRRRKSLRRRILRVLAITPATLTDLVSCLGADSGRIERDLEWLIARGLVREDVSGVVPRYVPA